MNFLSKKTRLNITQFFLTCVALVLLVLCPYKTAFAAASADNTAPTHLELPKPTGGTFELPYRVRVANFNCSLETFVREKALPNRKNEMTLQLYGNLDFDSENFDSVRLYIGKKTIRSEPHPPIASYTLHYTNEQTPPRLLQSSFNGKSSPYQPAYSGDSASAYGYGYGYEGCPQDTLFYPQDGCYYTTPAQPPYYGQPYPYGAPATYGYDAHQQAPVALPALIANLSAEQISS